MREREKRGKKAYLCAGVPVSCGLSVARFRFFAVSPCRSVPSSFSSPNGRASRDGSAPVLDARHLTKTFQSAGRRLTVVDDVSLRVEAGETCAVVGPSGSGKTTLLGLCAGLDRPTSGHVRLCGAALDSLDEDARAELRSRCVGFVFQTFRLIETLTARENVMVPIELAGGGGRRDARERAEELLGRVGLSGRLGHYPAQLSGGEQQRVALARAFMAEPQILFADEPTGNLDAETARAAEDLIFDLNEQAGTALVLVTHDEALAERTGRPIRLRGGRVVEAEAGERAAETADA
jgi:putative ABC transport system ATP-binding protein